MPVQLQLPNRSIYFISQDLTPVVPRHTRREGLRESVDPMGTRSRDPSPGLRFFRVSCDNIDRVFTSFPRDHVR
jgi:hypothetical protein